jgi:hypothetical protein
VRHGDVGTKVVVLRVHPCLVLGLWLLLLLHSERLQDHAIRVNPM